VNINKLNGFWLVIKVGLFFHVTIDITPSAFWKYCISCY